MTEPGEGELGPLSVDPEPKGELELDRLRFAFSKWTLVFIMMTTAILLLTLFAIVVSSDDYRSRLVSLIFTQAPAAIGVPFCGAIAMFVVLMLRTTQGPIEFEAIGFKFRGASGPIVMWVICFLAAIAATRLLWL